MGDVFKKKNPKAPKDNYPVFVQSFMHIIWQYNSTTTLKFYFYPHFLNLQAIKTVGHHHDNKVFQLIQPQIEIDFLGKKWGAIKYTSVNQTTPTLSLRLK